MKKWSLFWMILVLSLGILLLVAPALADNDENDDDDDNAFDYDGLATATYDPLTGTYTLTMTDGEIQLVMNYDGSTWMTVVNKKMATGSNYIDIGLIDSGGTLFSSLVNTNTNTNTFDTIDTGGTHHAMMNSSHNTIDAFGNNAFSGTMYVQSWQVSDVDNDFSGFRGVVL